MNRIVQCTLLLAIALLGPTALYAQTFTLQKLNEKAVGVGTDQPKALLNIPIKRTVIFGVDSAGGTGRPTIKHIDKWGSLPGRIVDFNYTPAYSLRYQGQPIEPKMIWYGNKGAFRAGGVYTGSGKYNSSLVDSPVNYSGLDTYEIQLQEADYGRLAYTDSLSYNRFWNNDEIGNPALTGRAGRSRDIIGDFSFASGANTRASGQFSTAMGYQTQALGHFSTALGYRSWALGDLSFAIGNQSVAGTPYTQDQSRAVLVTGRDERPKGNFAICIGSQSMAYSDNSIVLGNHSFAGGIYSVAIGFGSQIYPKGQLSPGVGQQGVVYTKPDPNSIDSKATIYATAVGYKALAQAPYAMALGQESVASGDHATAMGYKALAQGPYSMALGQKSVASGDYATAIGVNSKAGGTNSFAMGSQATTDAANSMAFGTNVAIPAGLVGSMIFGDQRTETFSPKAFNQLVMRFAGGIQVYTSPGTQGFAGGLQVVPNGNAWSTISDSTRKENFRSTDGAAFLKKISQMRLGSWNYKGQDAKIYRHYGPMAQDFFTAFGHDGVGTIGEPTLINQADFDGVNLIAIKALINEVDQLKADNQRLRQQLSDVQQLRTELESAHQREKTTQARLDAIEARLNARTDQGVATRQP